MLLERVLNSTLELDFIFRFRVGKISVLGVTPTRLNWVEFWRISRQPFEVDLLESRFGEFLGGGAMHRPAVP